MIRYITKLLYRVVYAAIFFTAISIFFVWNYSMLDSSIITYGHCLLHNVDNNVCANHISPILICKEKALPKNHLIVIPIIGALFCQVISLGYRCLYHITSLLIGSKTEDVKYDGLQRICLYAMMNVLTVIQALAAVLLQADVFRYSCKDFMGVESSPYYWIDWICTVPLMFFLVAMVDAEALGFKLSDLLIEALAGGSVILLFLTNFPLPYYINVTLFIASNIFMCIALAWQYIMAASIYSEECSKISKIPKIRRYDVANKLTLELYQRAEYKLNSSLYICTALPLFPLLYYLRLFRYIDIEMYVNYMFLLKYFTKALFTQVLSLKHAEAFDPSKLVLIEQKKGLDHSRMSVLRFILHEIRGPLNSIALGLQVLTETSSLIDTHDDIITAIRDGT